MGKVNQYKVTVRNRAGGAVQRNITARSPKEAEIVIKHALKGETGCDYEPVHTKKR